MSQDQQFSVSCNYSDFFNSLKFQGSDENKSFVEYQKIWIAKQQKAQFVIGSAHSFVGPRATKASSFPRWRTSGIEPATTN